MEWSRGQQYILEGYWGRVVEFVQIVIVFFRVVFFLIFNFIFYILYFVFLILVFYFFFFAVRHGTG